MSAPTMSDISFPRVDVHDMTERVQELASSAAERFEDLPERAAALAGTVIPSLRVAPKRSKRPVLVVIVAVSSVLAIAWLVRSRRCRTEDTYRGDEAGEMDVPAAS